MLGAILGVTVTGDNSGAKREKSLSDPMVTRVKKERFPPLLANSTAGSVSNLRRLHVHSQLKASKKILKMKGMCTFSAPNSSCFLCYLDHSESRGSILLVIISLKWLACEGHSWGHPFGDFQLCLVLGVTFRHRVAKLEGSNNSCREV